MNMNLDGTWRLGICEHQEYLKKGVTIHSLDTLYSSRILLIDGNVPGNVDLDMEEQGLIENPFCGRNPLKAQEREMNHLFYGRSFFIHPEKEKTYLLEFDGIDTAAEIFLNGDFLAKTDNMLIGHSFEIPGMKLKDGENEILVHIIPLAVEARTYDTPMFVNALPYEMDGMNIRKSAYMFGWDIFPRMLSGGIWKSVRLREKPEFEFLQSYLFTLKLEKDYSRCKLDYFYEVEISDLGYRGFELVLSGRLKESCFEKRWDLWSKAGHVNLEVENPILWWPRRSGEPNLYEVEVRLEKDGIVYARKNFRFGIRTVELLKTSLTDEEGSGEFCFLVNHKKTFILGTNWVPLDSFPSRGKEKILPVLDLVEDLDCNMIRCWGGGYYEDDLFYDKCDELGILVWQDFMQACALYPQDEEFLKKFEKEVTWQVRRLRQHPSVALWSGDNENDGFYRFMTENRLDPNENRNTREIIPRVLRMNDYIREYLPSSPYVDETAFEKDGYDWIPEQHLWGPRDYYKGDFYRNAVAHFASETGYHGCPSVESIRKFISPEAMWPYSNNGEWLLHASSPSLKEEEEYAYRIELMASQIEVLFRRKAENLEEFSLLSQISQAEAKKYFVERFRMGKWRRTGIIWWNVMDGCPQFSDAVVDYYFDKKMAYDYIRRSQERAALMCEEPAGNSVFLMGVNDNPWDVALSYKVTDVASDDNRTVAEGSSLLPADSAVKVALLDTAERSSFFLIEWECEGEKYRNHYVSWEAPFDRDLYLECAKKAGLL